MCVCGCVCVYVCQVCVSKPLKASVRIWKLLVINAMVIVIVVHCYFPGKVELALEDFGRAAALGSHFSRAQVVSANPYAALCNTMMTEMIDRVRRGGIDP